MGDLFVLLDEVESLLHDGIVLVSILPRLEKDFNHVLDSLFDVAFVQDGSESLENEIVGLRRMLREEGADFARESTSDLDRVGRRVFEKKEEDLESDDFMRDGLIDEVSDKRGGRKTNSLQGKNKKARSQGFGGR